MCQSTGYTTKGRKKILEYLKENHDKAVSVGEILTYLEKLGTPKNPSTIYRYLDELVRDGQILKHRDSQGEAAVYQYISKECHSHLHMQCKGCGKIVHLDCTFMREIKGHLQQDHGFLLECGASVLRGICFGCREGFLED